MRAFFAMAKTALRQQLQYRSAMLAGVFTQLVFGLIYIMVFLAFYRSGNTDSGMTAAQAVSYVWISQATYRMMPWSGIRDIDAMMRDGRIAFELARPRDIYGLWFARSMAMRTAPLMLNTPLQIYLKNGRVKAEIALARGKKLFDKRDDIAKKDAQRDIERSIKNH